MVKDIVIYPDDVLKKVAKPVEDINDDVLAIVKDMVDTMYEKRGIGLAAPQIGISKRIIVVDIDWPETKKRDPKVIINPVIEIREGSQKGQERCLSLPGIADMVKRSFYVKVRGISPEGDEVEFEGEDLLAVVFQHEIDHLDGKVFIDHLSRLKRNFYLRKLLKRKREGG